MLWRFGTITKSSKSDIEAIFCLRDTEAYPFGHNTFTEIQATHGNLKIGDPPKKNQVQISDKYGIRHECFETFFDRFEKAFIFQIKDFVNIQEIINKYLNH